MEETGNIRRNFNTGQWSVKKQYEETKYHSDMTLKEYVTNCGIYRYGGIYNYIIN